MNIQLIHQLTGQVTQELRNRDRGLI